MEAIPGADGIANVLAMLVREWEGLVEPTRPPHQGSPAWLEQHNYRGDIPEHLARQPAELAILTCVSMVQVARSLAALYLTTEAGLTIGHLPLVRSIMEGAGQVSWLLNGEGVGTAPDTGPGACRPRIVRGILLWAECLTQARRDFNFQELHSHADHAKALLTSWRADARSAFPTLDTTGRSWAVDGVRVPSFTEQAHRGAALGWWPYKPIGTYGWTSSVAHHRLYQIQSELTPAGASHLDYCVMPVPLEVTAGGVAAAWALLRACELVALYVGWPNDGYGGIAGWLHSLDAFVAHRNAGDE